MKPYVNKDFEYTNPPCTIGDMIRSLEYYTHVYPANQPKDEAFKAFYSPPLPRTGPYSHKKRMYWRSKYLFINCFIIEIKFNFVFFS